MWTCYAAHGPESGEDHLFMLNCFVGLAYWLPGCLSILSKVKISLKLATLKNIGFYKVSIIDLLDLGGLTDWLFWKRMCHLLSVWYGLYLLKYFHLYSMSHLKLLCIHFVKIFIKCFVKKSITKLQFILLWWINTVKNTSW